MENVYFEDYAGVSPQWLAVRVRLQGGLIPAYGDSLLCRQGSAASFFCACAHEAEYGDLLFVFLLRPT
jgi:hypothetical protein